MKLTKKQKDDLKAVWGNWGCYHSRYDKIILERLRELDSEFVSDLEEETKNAEFWYA